MKIHISVLILIVTRALNAQVTISQFGSPYSQNFDTLASSGQTATAVPAGWSFFEVGTAANTSYRIGNGNSSVGDTYSFGASGSSERAFGITPSGTITEGRIGAQFLNQTGRTVPGVTISYTGEQWLKASVLPHTLRFEYSLDATSLNNGSWTAVPGLSFVSPQPAPSDDLKTALDGNLPVNQRFESSTISGLNWAASGKLWVRWTDVDTAGHDHGLAIDGFQLTAIPEPGAYALAMGSAALCLAALRTRRILRA